MKSVHREKRTTPARGNPFFRDVPMKLNEFAAGLTKDGMLVLCLTDGEITDYLVTRKALRTLIRREGGVISAQVLDDEDRIINLNSLPEALKVLKL